jgi:hypothetical protein
MQPYIVNGSEQLTSDPYPLAPLVVPPTLRHTAQLWEGQIAVRNTNMSTLSWIIYIGFIV